MASPDPKQFVTGHVRLIERKRGAQFYARIRMPDGSQSQKRLGPAWTKRNRMPEAERAKGCLTEAQAQKMLDEKLEKIRRGESASLGTGVTFKDATDEFIRYARDVRRTGANTVNDYEGVITGYLLDEFGSDTPVETIDADRVETYKERLIEEGKLSNRTIVRHLTVLHGIFKRAIRKWGLASNPASADNVERPQVVYTGAFETLDRDEIDRLAAAASCDRDVTLYRVAAFTGLRIGELLALRWSDVDFLAGLVHVRRSWDYKQREEKVPKGKKARSVPMMAEVVDTFARLKEREHFTEDDDLVFGDDVGEHLDYYKNLARYKAALEKAGLPAIRFHDLRHAFGTAAIAKLDPFTVQSYMGHAHYSTTQRYLHHKPRKEDAAALAEAFAPAADDETAASGAKVTA